MYNFCCNIMTFRSLNHIIFRTILAQVFYKFILNVDFLCNSHEFTSCTLFNI